MKVAYSFSVLRYVHDPVTQEFINIGVAVYSPAVSYLRAICTTSYARITNTFQKIDGQRFRQLSRYIQDQINAAQNQIETALPFRDAAGIEQILASVLPPDDSAIQFSKSGVGLSSDLDQTLRELYHRFIEFYATAGDSQRRSDEEVWRVFREPLERAKLTSYLRPKRIAAPNYEYEFQRSWKNEIWHLYEPVSFDMVEGASMLEKANRWVGRATSLMDSSEAFCLNLLLGEPTDPRLKATFIKAENILSKMPVRKEFIRESDAEAFAEEFASEVAKHS
jgi:hypothetical protein